MQQQMDWRTALQFAGVGLIIVIVLRLAGFIGNFWAGLGVLAIGHMFVAAAYLPKWRRTAMWVVVIWTAVVVVKPIVWNSLSPQVQEAVSSHSAKRDARLSETFRGHGADAMQELAFYCSKTEQEYTQEVRIARQALDKLSLSNPKRSAEEAALQQKVKNVETWRQNCTKDFQYNGESAETTLMAFVGAVVSAFHPDSPKEWYDLLGILLLAGLGLYASEEKTLWRNRIGGTILLIFFFGFGRFVLFETNLTNPLIKKWEDITGEETPEEKVARKKWNEEQPTTPHIIANTTDPYVITRALQEGHKKVVLVFYPDTTGVVKTPWLELGSGCGAERFYYDLSPRDGKVFYSGGSPNGEDVGVDLPFTGSLKWEIFVGRLATVAVRVMGWCGT